MVASTLVCRHTKVIVRRAAHSGHNSGKLLGSLAFIIRGIVYESRENVFAMVQVAVGDKLRKLGLAKLKAAQKAAKASDEEKAEASLIPVNQLMT